jgi:hypothetical protein
MTTSRVLATRKTALSPRTTTDHPPVWPFPTYRGQPYRPPKPPKKPKQRPVWETAPPALL